MKIVDDYIKGIQSGKIPANKWVKLAIERQVNDLKRQDTKEFPYYFDKAKVDHVFKVFGTFKFTKGKWRGQRWVLMPWQAFILSTAYGWYHVDTGKRRFRDVYVKVPRKNAKTELMIGVGQYGFAYDGEKDPEIYWFATKKDQAKIGWLRQRQMSEGMIKESPAYANYCDTTTYRIFTKEGLGFVAYLGKDSKGEDGPSPFYGICDEYHAHPNDSMVEVIESGMGARESPIMWRITTAGTNPGSPCKKHEEFCENILSGKVNVESVFAIMYGIDSEDDLDNPTVWEKANPAYRYIDTLPDYLAQTYDKAKKKGGTTWVNFLTKNLNVWSDVVENWIELEIYLKYATRYTYKDLKGKLCFGGLDLASVRDTNALCLFFPAESDEDRHKALWWYWLPKDEAKDASKKHNIDYLQWHEDGFINLTEGNAVDYAEIAADITGVKITQKANGEIERTENNECPLTWFDIHHINFDRKFSPDAIPRLMDAGINMEPIGQGFYSMSAPTKMLEAIIANGEFDPGCNPVSEWQFSNIVIEQDASDNIKITKNKKYQQRKVDGMQALVMAIAGWMDWKANKKESTEISLDFF